MMKVICLPTILLILFLGCQKKDAEDNTQSIKDIDGNVYTFVTIGDQVWLKENLKTTKYSNGDLIGTTNPATFNIVSESRPKYQWSFDGNETNVDVFGRLYTWDVVTDSRRICPDGWHVPSKDEWSKLINYFGQPIDAYNALTESGTSKWPAPNNATNSSGFTALPGGVRTNSSTCFVHLYGVGYFWTSTEESPTSGSAYLARIINGSVSILNQSKYYGASVRCLKNSH